MYAVVVQCYNPKRELLHEQTATVQGLEWLSGALKELERDFPTTTKILCDIVAA